MAGKSDSCRHIPSRRSGKLGIAALEEHFTRFTLLIYNTSVPLSTLQEQVYPHLAPNIEFLDPLAHVRGIHKYKIGLRGFHCVTHFDFDIYQLHVQMNERGDGGRAIADGVMNLRQLRFYTYPLRTILVYDFVLTEGGKSFQITRQEEIWSLGDLIQNLPGIGRLYDASRRVAGRFFLALFWLSCAISARASASHKDGKIE